MEETFGLYEMIALDTKGENAPVKILTEAQLEPQDPQGIAWIKKVITLL